MRICVLKRDKLRWETGRIQRKFVDTEYEIKCDVLGKTKKISLSFFVMSYAIAAYSNIGCVAQWVRRLGEPGGSVSQVARWVRQLGEPGGSASQALKQLSPQFPVLSDNILRLFFKTCFQLS